MKRFLVITWHGEGRTLFYVVDGAAPEDDQPAYVPGAVYTSREDAERRAKREAAREGAVL